MGRMTGVMGAVLLFAVGGPAVAQSHDAPATRAAPVAERIEVPLRVADGRLIVDVQDARGRTHAAVVSLGMTLFTESGLAALESTDGLTVAGLPVVSEMAQTVPDTYLADNGVGAVAVIGGMTWNRHDMLIDVPNGKLVLQPIARAVRWPGVSLSSPARLQVFHDMLLRADVDFGGNVVGGLLELAHPYMDVGDALAAAVEDDRVASFRMGYTGWSDLPAKVTDNPTFRGWDPNGNGFVVVGAAIAYECVLAVSYAHEEVRTCLR